MCKSNAPRMLVKQGILSTAVGEHCCTFGESSVDFVDLQFRKQPNNARSGRKDVNSLYDIPTLEGMAM